METFRSQFKVQMKISSIRSDKDDTDIPLSSKGCSNIKEQTSVCEYGMFMFEIK